jgi:valyl-tRNA synthetase
VILVCLACARYIELAKSRLYGDDEAAKLQTKRVLVYVYDVCLRVLHPSMPFVTEELWQAIPHTGVSISLAQWPAANQVRQPTTLRKPNTTNAPPHLWNELVLNWVRRAIGRPE